MSNDEEMKTKHTSNDVVLVKNMSSSEYRDKLSAFVSSCKSKKDMYRLWSIFEKPKSPQHISVLLLNAPCHGFGDIVFAMKFASILKDWYGCRVKIATTQRKGFLTLGEKEENVLDITSHSKQIQCRKFSLMTFATTEKFDLIFVAPMAAEFSPDYRDVRKILPYSNRFNTFFVSEYNDVLKKHVDFNTGIGSGRLGLLFTDISHQERKRIDSIQHPYAVVYVAESIARVKQCVTSFITMVCNKYNSHDFEIVLPPWLHHETYLHDMLSIGLQFFSKVLVTTKEFTNTFTSQKPKNEQIMFLRFDVLPLPNQAMLDLMYFSVKDILLTGDQSITDALSCCVEKNIFYQIAPWKEDFGRKLAAELPNKWLSSKTSSCGSVKAIKYNSNYTKFKHTWDFRKLARPKFDQIFAMIEAIGQYPLLRKFVARICSSWRIK